MKEGRRWYLKIIVEGKKVLKGADRKNVFLFGDIARFVPVK